MSDNPQSPSLDAALRALLHGARAAIRTFHADGIETVNLPLFARAATRYAAGKASNAVAQIVAPEGVNDSAKEGTRAFSRSVWWKPPEMWRDDTRTSTGGVVSTRIVGSRWTQIGVPADFGPQGLPKEVQRALAKARKSGALTETPGVTIDDRLRENPIVAPATVAASWRLSLLGQTEHCGRRVQRVRAERGGAVTERGDSDMFSEYEWLVDVATGILLRSAALVDHAEAKVFETRGCTFDQDIAASVFAW